MLFIYTHWYSVNYYSGFIASFLAPQTWLLYVMSTLLGLAAAGTLLLLITLTIVYTRVWCDC